jgi:hypothetical protein
MNLEDYFEMLHKMAQKNPQSPASHHGIINNHHKNKDDELIEDDEEPLPPEDTAET